MIDSITPVSPEQRMLFDLQGYLVLPSRIPGPEIDRYLGALRRIESMAIDDGDWTGALPPALRTQATCAATTRQEDNCSIRMNGLMRLHPHFHPLIDHAGILPLLREFMGEPQLINTWSISKAVGAQPGGWHRGQGCTRYSVEAGVIRSFMTNVMICLTPNGPEDGCLCVLPGSHKSALAFAGGYEDQGREAAPGQVAAAGYRGLELPGSIPVLAGPGDVVIFTESLIHNGLAKTSTGLRSNLYCNWLHRHANVAAFEPHNLRHFLIPEAIRAELPASAREATSWMELVRDPFHLTGESATGRG